jgi:hypothetical protein
LVPCNRFLLFYNHPIWTDGRLIKTSSIEERVKKVSSKVNIKTFDMSIIYQKILSCVSTRRLGGRQTTQVVTYRHVHFP